MTTDAIPLHWSVDYSYHNGEGNTFKRDVLTCLEASQKSRERSLAENDCTLTYTVFPNFWRGFGGAEELAFGKLCITKKARSSHEYFHEVSYTNKASGEDMSLEYVTAADPVRSLTDKWLVKTKNQGDGLYRSMITEGHIVKLENEKGVELLVNGSLRFISGRFPHAEQLTCNWSLFECLAEIINTGISNINLLEDLQKLKQTCCITAYESMTIKISGVPTVFTGYILHGAKELPSYWWLGADGNVAMMSNTFSTYVLSEVRS